MSAPTAPSGENYVAMTDDGATVSSLHAPRADAEASRSDVPIQRAQEVDRAQEGWYAQAVPDTPRKKAWCSGCCCCLLLVFLLLFFLTPRGPRVDFEKLTVYVNGVVEQDLEFTNSNFYGMDVKSVYLEAGAKADDGNYYLIGSKETTDDFSIDALKSSTRTYLIDLIPGAGATVAAKCVAAGEVELLWQGSIDMNALATEYNDYDIGPWYVTVTCTRTSETAEAMMATAAAAAANGAN